MWTHRPGADGCVVSLASLTCSSLLSRKTPVRNYFFEVLSILLIGGSLLFFLECIDYLKRRDYVASLILMFIGLAVIAVGKEMARLALAQKD